MPEGREGAARTGSLSNSARRGGLSGQGSREPSAGGSENCQDQEGDWPAANGVAHGQQVPGNGRRIPGSTSSNGLMGMRSPLNGG